MKKKIVLNKEQKKCLESLEWLLFGKIAAGKTFLLKYFVNKYSKSEVDKRKLLEIANEMLFALKGYKLKLDRQ
jgi:hypothetical protein